MTTARELSQKSVAAIEAGDKEAWLALFADDAVLEDPVGVSMFDETGRGHRGKEAIGAFYDSVVAGNQVHFDVRESYGHDGEVANVVTITTTLPDGSKAIVDAVSCYRAAPDGKLASLRALWSTDEMRFESAPDAG